MRALSNQVVLRMREDLEDKFAPPIRVSKVTGGIEPRPVYGEVLDVGPGDQMHPDLPALRRGDVVVWDLSKIGPPVIEHGQPLTIVSFNALLGKLHNAGTPDEVCHALLDQVLTEAAPDMMQRQISSALVIPGDVLRDGMKERPGENVVTGVWERVVSAGAGIMFPGRNTCARCKCELRRLEEPDVKLNDLVFFNPAWSVDWRRGGRDLRFTPYSEIRAKADD